MASHLGKTFLEKFSDRYQILQQLGKKTGRRTLLARDLQTQALVVIKLLIFNSDFEWDDLKLFEREAETLKSLDHPAIPCYLDFFDLDEPNLKGFALVQTYIEAKSLEETLQLGRTFSEAEIKQVAKAILEILVYLHGQNPPVIHRDIKPSNILLTNRSGNTVGQVYLVDFGSVQTVAAKENGTITIVGTYGYMPPEQFGGRTVPASDLYSLGATSIYLLTGIHPADLPQADFQIEFEQSVNINPAFTRWLKQMTAPSLNRRFPSAQVALQALEQPNLLDAPPDLRKPTGSKVVLTKTTNSLEILIPPSGFNLELIVMMLFGVFWISIIACGTVGLLFIPFPSNFLGLLFSLVFWYPGLMLVQHIFAALFCFIRLHLDEEQISLTYETVGFKFNSLPSTNTKDISQLELLYNNGSNNYRPKVIVIHIGRKQFLLGNDSRLSEPELRWLAEELSDWLTLPIVKVVASDAG